ncbi:MAG: asparagine--tRNA ligase [Candidatus Aenigmarchaeota archaeon]|nr:asparagine--tRNA ligase [Candidatus Aenigmarchaeota archaeon]
MKFLEIAKILGGKEGSVAIRGWLANKRSSGGIQFLFIRDGSGIIQCTVRRDKFSEKFYEYIEKLPLESVLEIEGIVRKDPRAPGGWEILAEKIKISSEAYEGFPIAKKYHGPRFLLQQRHLWLRNRKMQLVLKIRSKFLQLARNWFEANGFTEFHSPMFTQAACEGGATLFPVKYFDTTAYLTQSWQLYAEAAIASLGKIYTIAPSFRAEKSRTRRHLTEFWHLEAEIPFCNFDGLIEAMEEFITFVCNKLAEEMPNKLKEFGRDPGDLLKIKPPFPKVTYDEAVKIIQAGDIEMKWGEDLTWEREKYLANKFKVPFFVIHFPKGIKAFYHKPNPSNPKVTLSVDMLAPEGYGEVIGAGERIESYDELMKRIEEEKLDPKNYQWYLDLRKYGSVPHAGFGLGVERTIAWICKLKHVRDAVAFPRLINVVYP